MGKYILQKWRRASLLARGVFTAFLLLVSGIFVAVKATDTDKDGWDDSVDSNVVSRAWIDWGEPQYITNDDMIVYPSPAWLVGASKTGGEWDTNSSSWHVGTGESNSAYLYMDLDRGVFTNDLVMELGLFDHTNSALYVDLLDSNDNELVSDVYGNILLGSNAEAFVTMNLALATNESASAVRLRRGQGEITVYDTLLYVDDDHDGLDRDQEAQLGTSDQNADSDNDGLGDYDEVFTYGTGPALADSDHDGISDGREVIYGTDPAVSNSFQSLPYTETFESIPTGDLDGQNEWVSTPSNAVTVQSAVQYAGQKAAGILSASTAEARKYFASTATAIWGDVFVRPIPGSTPSNGVSGSVAFFFDVSGQLTVRDGSQWLALTNHAPVTADSWVRLTVQMDYTQGKWLICLNGEKLAEDLNMSGTSARFGLFRVKGRLGYLDNFTVSEDIPNDLDLDNDSLPDGWEIQLFGNTAQNQYGDTDNDGLTNLQEYQAGTAPTRADSDSDGIPDGKEIEYSQSPVVSNVYSALPFVDDFEVADIGSLNSQNGWSANPASDVIVQTTITQGGSQAVVLSATPYAPCTMRHLFSSAGTNTTWGEFYGKPGLGEAPSDWSAGSAIFYFNVDGQLVVRNGSQWLTLTNQPAISAGDWIRITVALDYSTQKWLICIDGVQYSEDLDFARSAARLTAFTVQESGASHIDTFSAAYSIPGDPDFDNDGMPDAWEIEHFGSVTNWSGEDDPDNDDLNNGAEYQNGTDPTRFDTDGDGMADGWEVVNGFSPIDPSDAAQDADGDGWLNVYEQDESANPRNANVFPDADSFIYVNGLDLTPGTPDGTLQHPFRLIQDALDAAVAGQVIQVADGTYKAPRNRDLTFAGKAIMLVSEGGEEKCIIDCDGAGRGILFGSGEHTTPIVRGFTFENGYTAECGGAILCQNGCSPVIQDCILKNNIAEGRVAGGMTGAGIACLYGSSPTIVGCTMEGNVGGHWNQSGDGGFGSGISICNASPVIRNCRIANNTVTGQSGMGGIDCEADEGGYWAPVIENCFITGNEGKGWTGGVDVFGSCSPVIRNCTIVGNQGGVGCLVGNGPTIENSIIWGNSVFQISGEATVSHSDVQGGWTGAGANNIAVDPLLVSGSYRLKAVSPCIAAADPATATDVDFENEPRDSQPDIGADEYVDTDSDTMPDYWEKEHGLNWCLSTDAVMDGDNDEFTAAQEFELGFDPNDRNDGLDLLEEARQLILDHWYIVFDTEPPLSATGNQEDLADMATTLNALSGKFYEVIEGPSAQLETPGGAIPYNANWPTYASAPLQHWPRSNEYARLVEDFNSVHRALEERAAVVGMSAYGPEPNSTRWPCDDLYWFRFNAYGIMTSHKFIDGSQILEEYASGETLAGLDFDYISLASQIGAVEDYFYRGQSYGARCLNEVVPENAQDWEVNYRMPMLKQALEALHWTLEIRNSGNDANADEWYYRASDNTPDYIYTQAQWDSMLDVRLGQYWDAWHEYHVSDPTRPSSANGYYSCSYGRSYWPEQGRRNVSMGRTTSKLKLPVIAVPPESAYNWQVFVLPELEGVGDFDDYGFVDDSLFLWDDNTGESPVSDSAIVCPERLGKPPESAYTNLPPGLVTNMPTEYCNEYGNMRVYNAEWVLDWDFPELNQAPIEEEDDSATVSVYKMRREFRAQEFSVGPDAYSILLAARRLTYVRPATLTMGQKKSTEYEGVAWGQTSFAEAWNKVKADSGYKGHVITYWDQLWTDPGWIKGTKSAAGQYGAYLWVLQNEVTFTTPAQKYRSVGPALYAVDKVMVGTLGDYAPGITVTEKWPDMDQAGTGYPDCKFLSSAQPPDDSSEEVKYTGGFNYEAYCEYRPLNVGMSVDEANMPAGKIMANLGDADDDDILGYSDGYNKDGITGTADDTSAGTSFVPLTLSLDPSLDPDDAKLMISYDLSSLIDPLAGGSMRIWTKDGSEARTSDDQIQPDAEYTLAELGFADGRITLYIEGVSPAIDSIIQLKLSPAPGVAFMLVKEINVTIVTQAELELADTDGDGLADAVEIDTYGTDPLNWDTDEDALNDGWEVAYQMNPTIADPKDETTDFDLDGLIALQEYRNVLDPRNPDTDGDGMSDWDEVPHSPAPEGKITLKLKVGDASNSGSEKWEIIVFRGIDDVARLNNSDYGIEEEEQFGIEKGWTYAVKVFHRGHDSTKGELDYDWYASVGGKEDTGWGNATVDMEGGEVNTGPFHIDDSQDLLGKHWPQGSAERHDGTVGKYATLTILKVDLDIWNGGADLDNGEALGPQEENPLSETDEETVGAYLLVNWDDDDKDGEINGDGSAWTSLPKPDLEETTVTDEDNLAQLKPSLAPMLDTGTVELEVSGTDAGKIKLWTSSTKGTQVTLTANKKTWNLSDANQKSEFQDFMANSLWIEGVDKGSEEKGVTFTLRYKDATGTEIGNDVCKATVVMINLGNASCREANVSFAVNTMGHAAIVSGFNGKCRKTDLDDDTKFKIIQMQLSGPATSTLETMTSMANKPCYGCFAKADITYVQRLRVLLTAKGILDRANTIGWTGCCVRPWNWNDKLDGIVALRCDGLPEICYEWNGMDVWGKLVDGSTHFSVLNNGYQEDHDDNDPFVDWRRQLWPSTQCAHEPTYRWIDWNTTFGKRNLCEPVGTKGEN